MQTIQARLGAGAPTRCIGTLARNLQQRPAVRRASSRFLRSAAASAEPEVAAPAEAAPAEAAPAEAAPADAAPAERRAPRAGGNRRGGGGGSRPLIGPERAFGIDDIVVGKTYDGAVVSMTDFGAFVNIGCQTDGLLHISQISAAFVRDVKEALTIGQPVSVRVLTVDQQRGKFAVTAIPEGEEPPRGRRDDAYEGDGGFGGGGGGAGGARQERPRQATRGAQKQRRNSAPLAVTLGETLTAAITSVAPFGVFVDIGNGHNGMLHSSQMTLPEGVTDHVGHLKEGDELTVRVLRLERADKVALTQKSEEEVAADERTRTKGLAASEVEVPEGAQGFAFLMAKAGIKAENFDSRAAAAAPAAVAAPVAAAAAAEPAAEPAAVAEPEPVAAAAAPAPAPVPTPAAEPAAAAPAAAGGISAALVKQLRDASGAGMMDCKKALAECGGDLEEAKDFLRKKGLASADKKAGRVAAEGAVWSYIHAGSRLGVLVEVNCETDFVARGDKFQELFNDIAMQIAACPSITVVSAEDVPAEVLEREREIEMQKEDLASKPEAIRAKIVQGRVEKIAKEMALLEQPFIKDTSKTVGEVVKEAVAAIGENIQIRRFGRYVLGEGIQLADKGDFAAEVEAQSAAMAAKAAEKKEEPAQEAAAEPAAEAKPAVAVSAAAVKQLRDASGAGMMDCKKALAECGGDLEEAKDFLRKKGLASADKKAGRVAAEGAIAAYIHAGSRLGVLVEVNCETDFVARGDKFRELASDLAMQIAACPSITVVSAADVPAEVLEREREIEMQKEDLASKPEAIRAKIVQGRVEKIAKEMALLEQPFIKDNAKTVGEHIKEQVAAIGENMGVRRFERYVLGELVEKKVNDFAAEVAAQTGGKL